MYRSDLLTFSSLETGIETNYRELAAQVLCHVWVCDCRTIILIFVNGFKVPTNTETALICTAWSKRCDIREL